MIPYLKRWHGLRASVLALSAISDFSLVVTRGLMGYLARCWKRDYLYTKTDVQKRYTIKTAMSTERFSRIEQVPSL